VPRFFLMGCFWPKAAVSVFLWADPNPLRARVSGYYYFASNHINEKAALRGRPWSEAEMSYQPMSFNNSNVRSSGNDTEWVRSMLMAGSINWLRLAVVL
jgi:hypothetical protein